MINVLYIHGFNSGLKVDKIAALSKILNENSEIRYNVQGAQWDSDVDYQTNFNKLVEQATALNQGEDCVVLIGCSLGGFYARQVANTINCNAVLINPVVDPQSQLKCLLGQHTNYVTGKVYNFTEQLLNSYVIDRINRGGKLTYVSDSDSLLADNSELVEQYRARFGHIIHTMTDHRVDDYNNLHDFKHQVDLLTSSQKVV